MEEDGLEPFIAGHLSSGRSGKNTVRRQVILYFFFLKKIFSVLHPIPMGDHRAPAL